MRSRILALTVALSFPAVLYAQSARTSAHADIFNDRGVKIGTAQFSSSALGVRVAVRVSHLTAGEHGIHIHNVGKCEAPAFTSAGGHFNPTNAHHGASNTQTPHPHLGDLPNLTSDDKSGAKANFVLSGVTLGDGPDSLFHEGGTSIVIHAKPDDLMSDPSGNSGDRIACGVIEK